VIFRSALKDGGELAEIVIGAVHRQTCLGHQPDECDATTEEAQVASAFGHPKADVLEQLHIGRSDDRLADPGESDLD
jgi:hypothetical protein